MFSICLTCLRFSLRHLIRQFPWNSVFLSFYFIGWETETSLNFSKTYTTHYNCVIWAHMIQEKWCLIFIFHSLKKLINACRFQLNTVIFKDLDKCSKRRTEKIQSECYLISFEMEALSLMAETTHFISSRIYWKLQNEIKQEITQFYVKIVDNNHLKCLIWFSYYKLYSNIDTCIQ